MFQTKVVKKIETFYVQELFFENRAVYETMWKKYGRARQATDGNIIWCTCFACWITKAIDTQREYLIHIAFSQQQ